MKKLRWQLLVVVLALVAIGALLLTQQQSSQPGENLGDKPVVGGEYSEALIGAPGRLNPLFDAYNQVDLDIDRLVYCPMIRFDHRGLPQGDLVDSWGISRDGKTYNFSIRPEATWHDGQPVTSEDVAFTVSLFQDERLPVPEDLRTFWQQINVNPLDEKTLQFLLPEPFAPFLDYLTFGILPRHIWGAIPVETIADSPYNLNPIGCGPYRFSKLDVVDNRVAAINLESFTGYYGAKPFIEKLIFRFFPDFNAALAAYEQGQVMGLSRIPLDGLPRALANKDLQIFSARLPRWSLIYLNLGNPQTPFFKDQVVRRALLMSINRRRMIDRYLGGQAILANGPIFPESWAYYEVAAPVEYDPEAAITMLKRAGYTVPAEGGNVRAKDGVALSFELAYPQSDIYQQIAEQISAEWARIGIQTTLKPVATDDLLQEYLEPRTYQAAIAEINLDRSPDPDPYPFWHQAQIANGQNYSQWDDRQVSEYLEQARVNDDLEERMRRYRNFQVRWAAELPALPLFYPVYTYGVDSDIRGVSMGPLFDPSDRFNNVLSWYLFT